MAKIGFIGMGNMGHAILKGALKEYPGRRDDLLRKDFWNKDKSSCRDRGGIYRQQCRMCKSL